MPMPEAPQCVRTCAFGNDTFVNKVHDQIPAASSDAAQQQQQQAQMRDFLVQMMQALRDEIQNVVKVSQQDALEQQRLMFINQEVCLQKMMSGLLTQTVETFSAASPKPGLGGSQYPEQDQQVNVYQVETKNVDKPPMAVAAPPVMVSENVLQGQLAGTDPKIPLVALSSDDGGFQKNGRGNTMVTENSQELTPHIDVRTLYKNSGPAVRIVQSSWFNYCSLFMICAYAIFIGVDADWNPSENLNDSPWIFQLLEHWFTLFFAVELAIRFAAFSVKRTCMKDRWFVFDSIMVAMMVTETWIFGIVLAGAFGWQPPDTGALGGIGRLVRLLRLLRMSRLMQKAPELVAMVKGMVAAIRACSSALLILLLLVYVFAIIMNAIVGDDEALTDYYGTVRDSMVTLIVQGVLLDEISGLAWDMIDAGNALSMLALSIFILLSALTVMNMLIGVLCQVVIDVSAEEKENRIKAQMRDTLLVMLEQLDDDKSGELSKSEVQDVISEPAAVAILRDIQVDTEHLLDLTDMLYTVNSQLPISTIMNIVLSLRGTRPITMDDMAKGHNFLLWALETQLAHHRALTIEAVRQTLQSEISSIITEGEAGG